MSRGKCNAAEHTLRWRASPSSDIERTLRWRAATFSDMEHGLRWGAAPFSDIERSLRWRAASFSGMEHSLRGRAAHGVPLRGRRKSCVGPTQSILQCFSNVCLAVCHES